jgi:Tol biopolymer transport system component
MTIRHHLSAWTALAAAFLSPALALNTTEAPAAGAAAIPAPHDAATAPLKQCAPGSGLVWQNSSDIVELMTMGCDGEVHQLTHTPDGQGGSEAPRWGRDRLVYFDSDRAGQIHLFRMKAVEGAPAEQLTVTDGFEFSAEPTPDGRHIVFEHATADFSADGLFVMPNRAELGESAFRQLTSNPYASLGGVDTAPDVSPDGRTVAFIRVKDPTFGSAKSAVFTIRMDGTHVRQLTPYELDAFEPRWSPDGKWLVFSSHGDSFSSTVSADIYLMDKDGHRMRQVTHEQPGSHSFGPAWAPDGDRIVYTHVGPGVLATELVVRRIDRPGTSVVYTGTSGADQNPDWR